MEEMQGKGRKGNTRTKESAPLQSKEKSVISPNLAPLEKLIKTDKKKQMEPEQPSA